MSYIANLKVISSDFESLMQLRHYFNANDIVGLRYKSQPTTAKNHPHKP